MALEMLAPIANIMNLLAYKSFLQDGEPAVVAMQLVDFPVTDDHFERGGFK